MKKRTPTAWIGFSRFWTVLGTEIDILGCCERSGVVPEVYMWGGGEHGEHAAGCMGNLKAPAPRERGRSHRSHRLLSMTASFSGDTPPRSPVQPVHGLKSKPLKKVRRRVHFSHCIPSIERVEFGSKSKPGVLCL